MRRYASESTSAGGSNALLYGGIGAGVLGGGGYYYYTRQKGYAAPPTSAPASEKEEQNVPAKAEASKVFVGGDQGFIPLKLDKVEDINHNTSRFSFKFDDAEATGGLSVCSALLTKFKGENDEKPTIKPYTPVSDEGKSGMMMMQWSHN